MTFAGADNPLMSSNRPTAMMITAASTIPRGSELRANSGSNVSISRATAKATRNPTNIASPPTAGIGRVCTVRSFGSYIQCRHVASRRTSGVTANVTRQATAPTIR